MFYEFIQSVYRFFGGNSILLLLTIPLVIIAHKKFQIKIRKLVIGLLTFSIFFYIFNIVVVGDSSTYIPAYLCSAESRELINEKRIDKSVIKDCTEYSFNSSKAKLVIVSYSIANDCLGGCDSKSVIQLRTIEKNINLDYSTLSVFEATKELDAGKILFSYGSLIDLVKKKATVSWDVLKFDNAYNLVINFDNYKRPEGVNDSDRPTKYVSDREVITLNGVMYINLENINAVDISNLVMTREYFPIDDKDINYCDKVISLGLLFNFGRDACFRDLALVHNSTELCSKIKSDVKKSECYLNLALENQDYLICNNIPLSGSISPCITDVGAAAGSPEICLKGSSNFGKLQCIRDLSKEQNNVELCNMLELPNSAKCISSFAKSVQNETICENITDLQLKDNCFYNVALETSNETICAQISAESTINTALYGFTDAEDIKKLRNVCVEETRQGLKN